MGASADYRYEQRARRIGPGRSHGYEQEPCGSCGHYTLVRITKTLACETCGGTDDQNEATPCRTM